MRDDPAGTRWHRRDDPLRKVKDASVADLEALEEIEPPRGYGRDT